MQWACFSGVFLPIIGVTRYVQWLRFGVLHHCSCTRAMNLSHVLVGHKLTSLLVILLIHASLLLHKPIPTSSICYLVIFVNSWVVTLWRLVKGSPWDVLGIVLGRGVRLRRKIISIGEWRKLLLVSMVPSLGFDCQHHCLTVIALVWLSMARVGIVLSRRHKETTTTLRAHTALVLH